LTKHPLKHENIHGIIVSNIKTKGVGVYMTEKEQLQRNVEEFSRIQNYMLLCEKDSEVYKVMKQRYIELKVILAASGVNLTELDIVKE
jgi:hypothetical protein